MHSTIEKQFWRIPTLQWGYFLILAALMALVFWDGIDLLVKWWLGREEYSHGILIPFISAFLIWQKKNELAEMPFVPTWHGIVLVVIGLATGLLGELSAIYTLIQYACLITIFGIVWSICGDRMIKLIGIPVSFLFFAIPLPNFIYFPLSSKLQLLSSKLGVMFIRLFDISVYLEGNVIDLGTMQLQVVEACSGLRYLFPLMSLAFMCAYFYQASFWKRAVVFLSSIPITILMNSFRIGVIGVTSDRWGKDMAEGFLHDFEGWFIFMACTAVLMAEMWLLAQIGRERRPLMEVFGLVMPDPTPADAQFRDRPTSKLIFVIAGLLAVTALTNVSLQHREEIVPQRAQFTEFPMTIGDWRGQPERMEDKYVDTLKFDDYLLANYRQIQVEGLPINVYSAYYASQRKGESIHSPRACIPGGGWQIDSLEQAQLDGIAGPDGKPLTVNRLIIKKAEDIQLVYYWFQQRGRVQTNEYLVKWFLFWDALTKNRSDGALVRVTIPIPRGNDPAVSEQQLKSFVGLLQPTFKRFLPD